MAVGNVGETLEEYDQSDTFLSCDAGFTWEEVHKDAHLWEFGDSGSILIMANDEGPTDHVMFSTDEGLNWREYKFTDEAMRVKAIVTVPADTSRRFILLGYHARAKNAAVAVHLDLRRPDVELVERQDARAAGEHTGAVGSADGDLLAVGDVGHAHRHRARVAGAVRRAAGHLRLARVRAAAVRRPWRERARAAAL